MKESRKGICDAVKEYMIAHGITQKGIAERFGISQACVSRYISGAQPFGKKVAQQWADEFGFNASFLLTGEGRLIDEETTEEDEEDEPHPDETTSDIQLLKERLRNEALQSQVNQLQAQLAEAYKRIGMLEASMECGNMEERNAEAL